MTRQVTTVSLTESGIAEGLALFDETPDLTEATVRDFAALPRDQAELWGRRSSMTAAICVCHGMSKSKMRQLMTLTGWIEFVDELLTHYAVHADDVHRKMKEDQQ